MTTDPAYQEWRRLATEAEERAARRVKALLATVHYPARSEPSVPMICTWCRLPWPCKTAEVVELDEIIDDRERIVRAVQQVIEGQPHRELLRPTVMQIIGIIRRGG